MKKKPQVITTEESDTGRNIRFQDTETGQKMTLKQFVKAIDDGKYPDYHNRMINGTRTPASNPDKTHKNNLG